ncbi:MAG: UDP-N-acetylmuramyl peptide synthase, partial [Sphaerochaetaceae bacterium]
PEQILGDLEEGIRASGTLCTVTRIHDRRVAIAKALEEAAATDIVLLLAKGHETSIQYPLGAIPWNELEVAKELLALRRNLHA